MSLGRIDIEVTDEVAPTIQTKIDGIADSADKAQSSLDKLQKSLAKLDAQPFVALAKAYTQLNDAVSSANDQYLAQENALNKAIAAEANAQRATLALQQAQDKATASTTKAVVANTALADSQVQVYNSLMKQKAAQTAANAQSDINALLGVSQPSSNSAKASASVFAEALKAEETAAKAAAAELALADAATEHFGFTTAKSKTELLVLAHELSQGRYKNFAGSLAVIGEQTGLMSVAFSAAGLAVIGLTAAFAGFVYYSLAGDAATASLTRTLQATNGVTGITTSNFYAASDAVAQYTNTSKASSRDIAQQLAATGQLREQQVFQFTASAQLLSKLTGQSTDDIVKDFAKAADAPAKYAAELDKSLNFLSTAQLQHIQNLELEGDKSAALNELSSDLYNYLGTQAPAQLGYLGQAWESIRNAISNASTSLKDFGKSQTSAQQIANLQSLIANDNDLKNGNGFNLIGNAALDQELKGYNDQLALLIQQQAKVNEQASDKEYSQYIQQLGKDGLTTVEQFLKLTNNVNGASEAIKKFEKSYKDVLAADPTNANALLAQTNSSQIETAIRKQYEGKQGRKDDNAAQSRATDLAKYIAQLNEETGALGLVGDARERVLSLDKLDIQLKALNQGKGKGLTPDERGSLDQQLQQEQQNKRINEAGNTLDALVNGPQKAYDASLVAIAEQLGRGTITQDDATAAINRASTAYIKAKDPLYDINKAIGDQEQLYGQYGDALQLSTQLQAAENVMQAQGKSLYDATTGSLTAQGQALSDRYTQLNKNQQLDKLIGQIWQQNVGAGLDLEKQIQANNDAFAQGLESLEQYNINLNKIKLSQDQLKVNNGTATFADAANASLAKFQSSYQGVAAGATQAFGNFFDSFANGAADAFGKAITGQESFKQAIEETAQSALSALISALIKIGIQYLINAALGQTAASTTAAASTALAASTATAWAPAAALVNAATFGAAADAADVSLPITFGIAEAIAAGSFQVGGYTGNSATNVVAGVVHGQEYVTNAAATARNRPVLEAMNRGATFSPTGTGKATGSTSARSKVDVHNYTGTSVRVEQDDDNTRIIVGQELQKQLPKAMGNEVTKPNSPFNKNMRKFTTTKRRVS